VTSATNNETVMTEGMHISALTDQGQIIISAGHGYERTYAWGKCYGTVEMWPRTERWYGSLGLYYPGPGSHWKKCEGILRAVVQEGQQHFKSVQEALDWIHSYTYFKFVYSNDGLVVGWKLVPAREQLSAEIWQIFINGKKPTSLPGASANAVRVSYNK
jgi:hypothetical protein